MHRLLHIYSWNKGLIVCVYIYNTYNVTYIDEPQRAGLFHKGL
jgi:hypothetical protein